MSAGEPLTGETTDLEVERIDVPIRDIAKAFNEWMRRYIEEPERFEAEFRSVQAFQAAELREQEPDYGTACTAYLIELMSAAAP